MTPVLETALSLHDSLLVNAPEGVVHDNASCPFCTDWAMTEDGVPAGIDRVESADAKAPYGNVDYADPGFLRDKVKRFPIDTEVHARAAWTFIHQSGVAEKYSPDQLASIRTKIQAALDKHVKAAADKEVEQTKALADAKRGPEKPVIANAGSSKPKKPSTDSSASTTDRQPEAVASEGGTSPMETITTETHEALLEKALRDATASLEAEKAALAAQVASLQEAADTAASEAASLNSENERLNGELDTAQVALKTAQDEASALKADIAAKEEAAAKAEVASERAGQVRNLGLFSEDYITEKASRWADMDEVAWTERLGEWQVARGQQPIPATTTADTASAMTGSSEVKHETSVSARRAALGLTN